MKAQKGRDYMGNEEFINVRVRQEELIDELVKALNSIKTNQKNNFDSGRYFWLNSDLKKWKNLLYS